MYKVLNFLRPLLSLNYHRPFTVIFVALLLAVVGGYYSAQLRIDTDLANLLPDSYKSVQALEELKETVGGETPLEVAIKSPSFEDNRRFAKDLVEESMDLHYNKQNRAYFDRYEFKKDVQILKDNALYFATKEELEQVKQFLKDEIEEAKLQANPFYVDLEEDTTDGNDKQLESFQQAYESLIPDRYPVSDDSTVMVLHFYPNGSKNDIQYLQDMFADYDSLIASMSPETYNEEMVVKAGGRLKRHLNEFQSIITDVKNSFASGILGVILLVMFYFTFKKYWNYRKSNREQRNGFLKHVLRIPIPALVIGIPLVFSLLWTFGLTYLVLGSLNTMTSVLFVILFGLGIDYGIHFYARYIELRTEGLGIYNAVHRTYFNTGSAIVTSAVTTASALYVLMFADFRGFSEFGFISGTGILLALFSMMFILPSVLVLFEKFNWIILKERLEENKKGRVERRFPFARSLVVLGAVIVTLVAYNHKLLSFQYEFGELEPEFKEYREFRQLSSQVFSSGKRNAAYILADTDEQVIEIVDKLRERMRQDTTSPTIQDVEALQERYPNSDRSVKQKLKRIAEVRELLQDSFLKDRENEELEQLRQAAQTTEALDFEKIPDYLKNRFVTKDGEIGRFVMVYPSVGLSDGRKSIAFKNDVEVVELDSGEKFYAASTSIVAAEMLELMRKESPYMVAGTLLLVFLFMIAAFRSLRWAIISLIPLVVGLVCTFGIMMLFGMQFNFYNLIVLPAILGIGEDNGVHIAFRYREEGHSSMWSVLSSTGQHISMGSVTTMLGFSGLLFTNHPGLRSIGQLAVIGIGMTLLTALIFLPAIIQWLEDRNMIVYAEDEQYVDERDMPEKEIEFME